jgi:hypothetical protein
MAVPVQTVFARPTCCSTAVQIEVRYLISPFPDHIAPVFESGYSSHCAAPQTRSTSHCKAFDID